MAETKEKIVETADQLVRKKGYNAFSYKDISGPLEIKNAAVHYHFPAKMDLGIAVIDQEIEKFLEKTREWSNSPEDEQIAKLFSVFDRHNKQDNICLVASFATDFKTLEAPMQAKVQEMSANLLEWLTKCLESGRAKALFKFEGSASTRALIIITNLQSSLLLARIMGPAVFQQITNQLLEDLRS
ncbi:TetR/AcrR family transcriptional regulator [Chitinophaga silvatica]|uniref:TetR/AcrR family transcriptional regulator n=1 Tax=Chitinophaga silvatica TaxID=2282649 RepID=A0A3E1Y4B5_9BACT|nr:TetR family transcriptional regulator [Chitinophaga silvatica]RFS19503.1 TetR/AcrR family transcriptional regulator [Chitinophaga silvatica]